jgi:hypothetical protein
MIPRKRGFIHPAVSVRSIHIGDWTAADIAYFP